MEHCIRLLSLDIFSLVFYPIDKFISYINICLGIERQTIVNIAKANNIPLKEEDFTLDFFLTADEIFMSRYFPHTIPSPCVLLSSLLLPPPFFFPSLLTILFPLTTPLVFYHSTTKEVLPIKQVDDVKLANVPGPVTRQLIRLFVEYVEKELGFVHPKRKLLTL